MEVLHWNNRVNLITAVAAVYFIIWLPVGRYTLIHSVLDWYYPPAGNRCRWYPV